MSFSRRGIIAAGLAIASVGAIGISSNLNAGAATLSTPDTATTTTADTTTADTTTTTDSSTADADAATSLPVPPPGLPGGRVSSRRPDQTDPDASRVNRRPLGLTPRRGPKGNPRLARSSAVRASADGARAVAPAPPGTDVTGGVTYHYSQASQEAPSNGGWGFVTVAKPALTSTDYHSLAELAVRSADLKQTVEVGWTVDPVTFGDVEPRLFVYHWVDGVGRCYNGCGFVQYSTRTKLGSVVPVNTTKALDIQFFGDGWWIGYDSDWIGYFPSALWGGRFTRAGAVQWFGEVAARTAQPCTNMGNGTPGDQAGAAKFDRLGLYGGPAVQFRLKEKKDASPYYPTAYLNSSFEPQEPPKPGELAPAYPAFGFGGTGAC